MAQKFMHYIGSRDPGGTQPRTLVQLTNPAHQRGVVHRVDIQPYGSTGASAALKFDWCTQVDTGTGDSADLIKTSPAAAEDLLMTAKDTFTVEPATPVSQYQFGLHQQTSRVWIPLTPFEAIVMVGGSHWGLRILTAFNGVIGVVICLEE